MVYYEIIKNDNVVHRSTDIISLSNFNIELNYVPRISLTISACIEINGHEEVIVYIDDYAFHGIVWSFRTDVSANTITLNLRHVLSEWKREQIATNMAFKKQTFETIYRLGHLEHSNDWNMIFDDVTRNFEPYHVYSREDKLSGLDTTIELTPSSHYRVSFDKGRALELGVFGEDSGYILSTNETTERNLEILSISNIDVNLTDVVNVAVVYGDKEDTGMTNLNLRDAFMHGTVDPNFPIVVLRSGINNEREYQYIQFPKLAPNNYLEFGVIDAAGIAQERGAIIEGSFSFNNLSAFGINGEEITDDDRIRASQSVYERTKRELVSRRRSDVLRVRVAEIPKGLKVGSYIRPIISEKAIENRLCDEKVCEIISRNEKMYITAIRYEIVNGVICGTLTLDNSVRVYRESSITNTPDTVIARILQAQNELTNKRHNDSYQRRSGVIDNYGIEYVRQGSSVSPAQFLISVSPDLIYYKRFEFKVIVSAFMLPISDGNGGMSVTPTAVSISSVSLEISDETIGILPANLEIDIDEEAGEKSISPNPHGHEELPHRHNMSPSSHDHISTPHVHEFVAGVTNMPVVAENFMIEIDGIDITPFLMAQHPNGWIDGTGIFPSSSSSINFDILDVVGLLSESQREQILSQGYKTINIFGDGLFNGTYVNYLKYNHTNR